MRDRHRRSGSWRPTLFHVQNIRVRRDRLVARRRSMSDPQHPERRAAETSGAALRICTLRIGVAAERFSGHEVPALHAPRPVASRSLTAFMSGFALRSARQRQARAPRREAETIWHRPDDKLCSRAGWSMPARSLIAYPHRDFCQINRSSRLDRCSRLTSGRGGGDDRDLAITT